jgi:hypothetical protein
MADRDIRRVARLVTLFGLIPVDLFLYLGFTVTTRIAEPGTRNLVRTFKRGV